MAAAAFNTISRAISWHFVTKIRVTKKRIRSRHNQKIIRYISTRRPLILSMETQLFSFFGNHPWRHQEPSRLARYPCLELTLPQKKDTKKLYGSKRLLVFVGLNVHCCVCVRAHDPDARRMMGPFKHKTTRKKEGEKDTWLPAWLAGGGPAGLGAKSKKALCSCMKGINFARGKEETSLPKVQESSFLAGTRSSC